MMLSPTACPLSTLQRNLNTIAAAKMRRENPFFVPFKVSALPMALAQSRLNLVTDNSRHSPCLGTLFPVTVTKNPKGRN